MKIVTIIFATCSNIFFGQVKSDSLDMRKRDVENYAHTVHMT